MAEHQSSIYAWRMSDRRPKLATRRRQLGLTQEDLAELTNTHTATVSRWERGAANPEPKQRTSLGQALSVSIYALAELLGEEVPGVNRHSVPGLDHYASLEQGAAKVERYDPATIPGLLQTAQYARAVMLTHYQPVSEDQMDHYVSARVARAAALRRQPNPLNLHCIIHEGLLSGRTGGPAVMREQLYHLRTMGTQPNVTLQVAPAGADLHHWASFGPFVLFTAEHAAGPFMACTETVTGFNYVDGRDALKEYSTLFRHLAQAALSPKDSAALISTKLMETNQRLKT